jgi:protein phosphatase
MRWEQQVQYASLSDIGFRRQNNEDSCAVHICPDPEVWKRHGHLFMVADGMGGHAVGELASKIAVDTLPHAYYKGKQSSSPEALKESVELANAAIHERAAHNRDFDRMGTTCTVLVLSGRGALVAHVGDSRVYRVRGDRIDQLTCDHSLAWELRRQGDRTADLMLNSPRHVITRSLGPEENVQVDTEGPFVALPGDTYVLCSDGLTGHLRDEEIGMIAGELPPSAACRMLVNLANLRGGSDNITVVVARIGELPQGLEPEEEEMPAPTRDGWLHGWWLVAFWGIAIAAVTGASLWLLGWVILGVSLVCLAVIAVGALVLRWLEKRQEPQPANRLTSETIVWRPYATASARLSRRFVSHIAAIEEELHRTAAEEGWTINWQDHEEAFRQARKLFADKQYRSGFLQLANAIDVLMVGIIQNRRQVTEQKRGREAPAPQPKDPKGDKEPRPEGRKSPTGG